MSTEPASVAPTLILLKQVATLFFFIFFVVLVGWLMLARSDKFQRTATIPLDDDTVVEPRDESANDV